MKQNLFLIGLLLWACKINAQCVKNISTNPASPVNAELSTLYPTKTNPWLNTLQWENTIYLNPNAGWQITGYTGPSPLAMFSPFSTAQPAPYEYLRNAQSLNALQYSWANGWELLWLNTGYYPNGNRVDVANSNQIPGTDNVSSLANNRVPYFILYNRYTGIMRPFVNAFTDLDQFNEVQTIFKYSGAASNLSGIFRNINGVDQALDQKTSISQATSYNKNLHNNNYWWTSDVPLSYDPCVCHYATNFNMWLTGFDTMSVNLYGRSLSTTQALKNSYGLNHQDFLSAAAINDVGGLSGGNIMYKSMDKMLDDYNQQLTDYENAKADYNSVTNTLLRTTIGSFKDVLSQGISAGVSSFIPTNAVKQFILNKQLKVERSLLSNDSFKLTKGDTNTAQGWADKLKETAKSELGKQLDHLTMQLLPNNTAPQPPVMPTATFTEMRFSGSIASSSSTFVTNFFTPGSTTTTGTNLTPYVYPAYNNPVGLFALLETPKISLYKINTIDKNPVEIFDNNVSGGSGYTAYDDRNGIEKNNKRYKMNDIYTKNNQLYFKITDPLKYALNHAVDINNNKSKLYVLFQVELQSNDLTTTTQTVPMTLGNFNLEHGYDNKLMYSTDWYPMKDLGETVFGFNLNKYETKSSTLAPEIYSDPTTDAILQSAIRANYYPGTTANPLDVTIKKIKMKIMTDLYFNSTTTNTTNVYTHIIYDADNNIDVIQSNGAYTLAKSTIRKYEPGKLLLNGAILSPTHPAVTSVVGNVLYVDAQNIVIQGTIDVQAGYSAEIRAVEEINVIPNSEIRPNITLSIKQNYFGFPAITEVSANDVASFCTGTNKKYQANSLRSTPKVADKEPTEGTKVVSAVIYPNPTFNVVNVSVSNSEASDYSFRVYDMTGKIVIDEKQNSEANPTFQVDMSNLINGIYIFELSSGENLIKREKIMKM